MTIATTETKNTRRIRRPEGAACPACNHRLATIVDGHASVYRCARCKAIYGSCYLGDSYSLVLPFMVASEPPADRVRYFDLECLGSRGITRRHGWYDTETKRIVQVG